jgi:electron transfer flavoprotein beta subunit
MGAKKKPVEQLDLAALGVDAGSVGSAGARTVVSAVMPPPPRESGILVEDDGSAAQQLVDYLAGKSLV